MSCMQWGMLTDTAPQWGVGDGEGPEDLWHVCNGGHSVTHVPSGGWRRGGRSLPCMQLGCSPTLLPSGGWGRRGRSVPCLHWGTFSHTCPQQGMMSRGSVPCTHCWTLTDTCPQVGMGEDRRICTMYIVRDVQSHM